LGVEKGNGDHQKVKGRSKGEETPGDGTRHPIPLIKKRCRGIIKDRGAGENRDPQGEKVGELYREKRGL